MSTESVRTSEISKPSSSSYAPPQGVMHTKTCRTRGDRSLEYEVRADWVVLRKKEKPVAEMFYTFYQVKDSGAKRRPITFVFNGGPGAASAYLHIGGLGPQIIRMTEDGNAPKPPAELTNNEDTWLAFTDLVFVDPVGTGFSRALDEIDNSEPFAKDDKNKGEKKSSAEFYQMNRDLDSLGEFMSKFLSKHRRWSSPVFVAGESYGGFRVAKLSRRLQEGYGIGLSGAILISPCIEWNFINASDYDALFWVGLYPSMAATAAAHGKSETYSKDQPPEDVAKDAEIFATGELLQSLSMGVRQEQNRREAVWKRISQDLGLSYKLVAKCEGRVNHMKFCRHLLEKERLWCGLYDSTITAIDPFPDRENFEGPDPTLFSIERVFCGGINTYFREQLEVFNERDYTLLSMEVNKSWKVDTGHHALDRYVGGADDIRYAMALNPHMKVFLTHGYFDLITPYYASSRIFDLMKLDDRVKGNVTIKNFKGGHMFYTWQESRKEFTSAIQSFVESAL